MALLRWLRELFGKVAPPMGAVLPWVGVGLLMVAAGFAVRSWMFERERVKAVATVTENVSGFAKEGGVLYLPRVRFRVASGEWVTVESGPGSDAIEFAAGETVPVSYRVGDPQGAVIATVWRVYYWAIVFGIWGTALFDLGWALRGMVRRRVVG
jgi:hypothetical protein